VAVRQAGSTARWLDRDVNSVREGGSARLALRKWLPPDSAEAQRGWSDRPAAGMVAIPGASTAPGLGAGDYACPRDRCARRDHRDGQGHLPVCTAFDLPMRPV
jgi:hypothetical protein